MVRHRYCRRKFHLESADIIQRPSLTHPYPARILIKQLHKTAANQEYEEFCNIVKYEFVFGLLDQEILSCLGTMTLEGKASLLYQFHCVNRDK